MFLPIITLELVWLFFFGDAQSNGATVVIKKMSRLTLHYNFL